MSVTDERDPLCARAGCHHVRGIHLNRDGACTAGHGESNLGSMEPCECVSFLELPEGFRLEDNVDTEISQEMASHGSPFAMLIRLKQDTNGRAWVSPEVSLRMLEHVESAAMRAVERLNARAEHEQRESEE